MVKKFKAPEEWIKQSDYDVDTADAMFKAGRYIYTVFMCHLSIEKVLKSLYAKRFKQDPPKIHNLNYFSEKIELKLSEELHNFMDNLNNLSVPARYPDDLDRLLKDFNKEATKKVLNRTKELLQCLKEKL